jgi:hypothetical protein
LAQHAYFFRILKISKEIKLCLSISVSVSVFFWQKIWNLARIKKRKKKCETLEGFVWDQKNGPMSSNNEGIN